MNRTKQEIVEIVIFFRLELYNRGLPCGADAIKRRFKEKLPLSAIPSATAIGRILRKNGLTYRRTGLYDEDEPESS